MRQVLLKSRMLGAHRNLQRFKPNITINEKVKSITNYTNVISIKSISENSCN